MKNKEKYPKVDEAISEFTKFCFYRICDECIFKCQKSETECLCAWLESDELLNDFYKLEKDKERAIRESAYLPEKNNIGVDEMPPEQAAMIQALIAKEKEEQATKESNNVDIESNNLHVDSNS